MQFKRTLHDAISRRKKRKIEREITVTVQEFERGFVSRTQTPELFALENMSVIMYCICSG